MTTPAVIGHGAEDAVLGKIQTLERAAAYITEMEDSLSRVRPGMLELALKAGQVHRTAYRALRQAYDKGGDDALDRQAKALSLYGSQYLKTPGMPYDHQDDVKWMRILGQTPIEKIEQATRERKMQNAALAAAQQRGIPRQGASSYAEDIEKVKKALKQRAKDLRDAVTRADDVYDELFGSGDDNMEIDEDVSGEGEEMRSEQATGSSQTARGGARDVDRFANIFDI